MDKRTYSLFFNLLVSVHFCVAQNCEKLKTDVDAHIVKLERHIDSLYEFQEKPDYIESYIIYPVLKRYYNKSKNKDTAVIRKFKDFERAVWCYKGVCFNNNKSFYLSKENVTGRIKNNDLSNSYMRESICMLCDKYLLDSAAVKKILDFRDTMNENENADNYTFLHKALMLSNLYTNKCITKELFNRYKFPVTDSIYRKFISSFWDSIQTNKATMQQYDLFTEALLMISVLDDKVNISDELYVYAFPDLLLYKEKNNQGLQAALAEHTNITRLWLLYDLRNKLTKNKW